MGASVVIVTYWFSKGCYYHCHYQPPGSHLLLPLLPCIKCVGEREKSERDSRKLTVSLTGRSSQGLKKKKIWKVLCSDQQYLLLLLFLKWTDLTKISDGIRKTSPRIWFVLLIIILLTYCINIAFSWHFSFLFELSSSLWLTLFMTHFCSFFFLAF